MNTEIDKLLDALLKEFDQVYPSDAKTKLQALILPFIIWFQLLFVHLYAR